MRTMKQVLFGALVMTTLSAFGATNHQVIVGQDSQGDAAFAFNPSTLLINAGDTVTFVNFQNGFHNVASTSGPTTFKCSVNCTDNSDPAGSSWSQTVTFPTAGTVHYQCDQHAASGMTGTLTVQGTTPVRLESMDVKP
jgi:plastocyanin